MRFDQTKTRNDHEKSTGSPRGEIMPGAARAALWTNKRSADVFKADGYFLGREFQVDVRDFPRRVQA